MVYINSNLNFKDFDNSAIEYYLEDPLHIHLDPQNGVQTKTIKL